MADTTIFQDIQGWYQEARTSFGLPAITARTAITAAAPAVIPRPAAPVAAAPAVAPVPSSPQVVPTTVMPNGQLSTQVTPAPSVAGIPWMAILGLTAVALGAVYLLRKR